MIVDPHACGFAARISQMDLTLPLDEAKQTALRAVFAEYPVLSFPDQPLSLADLERFTRYFGDFGVEPYVQTLADHPHVIEVRREPGERAMPFGASWHSDWSFLATPPAATILHARVVPPVGGDTLYADGCAAFEALPTDQQRRLMSLSGVHSARRPYSPEGFLAGGGQERSMTILPSEQAYATQTHPMIRRHPLTGRPVLWVNAVYTVAIESLPADESRRLIGALCEHATAAPFVYRHIWQENMLTIWDNRRVQHCAQGGYDGYRRVMYRTTVAGEAPVAYQGAGAGLQSS